MAPVRTPIKLVELILSELPGLSKNEALRILKVCDLLIFCIIVDIDLGVNNKLYRHFNSSK